MKRQSMATLLFTDRASGTNRLGRWGRRRSSLGSAAQWGTVAALYPRVQVLSRTSDASSEEEKRSI